MYIEFLNILYIYIYIRIYSRGSTTERSGTKWWLKRRLVSAKLILKVPINLRIIYFSFLVIIFIGILHHPYLEEIISCTAQLWISTVLAEVLCGVKLVILVEWSNNQYITSESEAELFFSFTHLGISQLTIPFRITLSSYELKSKDWNLHFREKKC